MSLTHNSEREGRIGEDGKAGMDVVYLFLLRLLALLAVVACLRWILLAQKARWKDTPLLKLFKWSPKGGGKKNSGYWAMGKTRDRGQRKMNKVKER